MNTRRSAWLASAAAAICVAAPAYAQAQTYEINIGSQDMGDALRAFGRQTRQQVVFSGDAVRGLRSTAVRGRMGAREALDQIVAGSGLSINVGAGGVFMVRREAAAQTAPHGDPAPGEEAPSIQAGEEIVVTGTNIAGTVPVGSKLDIYTRADIERSGVATLDQYARNISGNLSNVDSISNIKSNSRFGRFGAADATSNGGDGSAFNLLGVGAGATLTLLNGHRITGGGSAGTFVDSSLIPLSVIERIEVLSDGASAIYGSDAVAGVVNIIPRSNFSGAETSIRYGQATDGGASEFTASQLLGANWRAGRGFLNYEFDRQGGLDASRRSYIPDQGGPLSLLPKGHRHSLFGSISQDVSPGTTISLDAYYTNRTSFIEATGVAPAIGYRAYNSTSSDVSQLGAIGTLRQSLGGDWKATLTVNYSKFALETRNASNTQFSGTTYIGSGQGVNRSNLIDNSALITGSLFDLPGGAVRIALGGGYRRENFFGKATSVFAGVTSNNYNRDLGRDVVSAFGEVVVPVIGPDNQSAFMRRLELSGAVRYDRYSNIGSTVNPKFGLSWGVADGFQIKATYGTSFQAPALNDLGQGFTYQTLLVASPAGPVDTLYISGINPGAKPQTSRSFTAGVELAPTGAPGLSMRLTYYNLRFKDRLAGPPFASLAAIFTDPVLAPFLNRSPSLTEVQAAFSSPNFTSDGAAQGAAGVTAIFDNRITNIASTRQEGLSGLVSYRFTAGASTATFSLRADHVFRNLFSVATGAPDTNLLNRFAQPPSWKGQFSATWNIRAVTASATANWTNGYENDLFAPSRPIASNFTTDLFFGWDTSQLRSPLVAGLKLNLSVQNLFDRRPPRAEIPSNLLLPGQPYLPFDPANSSPVGRIVSVQIVKRW